MPFSRRRGKNRATHVRGLPADAGRRAALRRLQRQRAYASATSPCSTSPCATVRMRTRPARMEPAGAPRRAPTMRSWSPRRRRARTGDQRRAVHHQRAAHGGRSGSRQVVRGERGGAVRLGDAPRTVVLRADRPRRGTHRRAHQESDSGRCDGGDHRRLLRRLRRRRGAGIRAALVASRDRARGQQHPPPRTSRRCSSSWPRSATAATRATG